MSLFWSWYSLPVHIDNKNNDILILGEELTRRLDDTTLAGEAKYPINFTNPTKKVGSKSRL